MAVVREKASASRRKRGDDLERIGRFYSGGSAKLRGGEQLIACDVHDLHSSA